MEPYKKPSISRAFYCMSLRVLSIGPLPSGFLHRASVRIEGPIFKAFLDMSYIAFRFPIRRALPAGCPHNAPIDRDVPFAEPSFICLSKSPAKRAPI
jgi:hypothetical protein